MVLAKVYTFSLLVSCTFPLSFPYSSLPSMMNLFLFLQWTVVTLTMALGQAMEGSLYPEEKEASSSWLFYTPIPFQAPRPHTSSWSTYTYPAGSLSPNWIFPLRQQTTSDCQEQTKGLAFNDNEFNRSLAWAWHSHRRIESWISPPYSILLFQIIFISYTHFCSHINRLIIVN